MNQKKARGIKGEALAVRFLEKEGFEILEKNWRYRRSEIDIIAREAGILVFVEVKYRSSDLFGFPEDFVRARQKVLIADAAAAYASQHHYEWAVRFDVLGVLEVPGKTPEVRLFRDAFYPG